MDFDEVKVVWNKAIPSIRRNFDPVEVLDYVSDDFSKSSSDKVRAQSKQHGQTSAADEFFQEAKIKPRSFPKILAALKTTNHPDVLIELLKSVKKYIRDDRQEFVFGLIRQVARDFNITVEEEIAAVNGPSHQQVSSSPGGVMPCTSPGLVNQLPVQHVRGSQPTVPTLPQQWNPQPAAAQPPHLVIYQRLQHSSPDVPLRDLKARSRTRISQALMTVVPTTQEPVWQMLLDNEDLDISGEEASNIEKSRQSGKDFYDKLKDLGVTTHQLIDMLERQGIHNVVTVVRQEAANVATPVTRHQPQASPQYKQDLAKFDENNLDLARQRSREQQQQQQLNIQETPKSMPPKFTSNSPPSLEHIDSSDDNFGISGEPSLDSLNEGKPTQAVEAVGDRDNENSTLTPELEREKLRNDRVGQHKYDQSNLESFHDVKEASTQDKDVNVTNQPGSHVFTSVSTLDQPELYQQQGASNLPAGTQHDSNRQQGASNNGAVPQSAGTQCDNTVKKVQLEHVGGPLNYAPQLESHIKLHADNEDSVCFSLSELQINNNEIGAAETSRTEEDLNNESSKNDQYQELNADSLNNSNENVE